ncbi:cryptochrome/deoxyribodipyrimidine photo-lyase family protein [Glaciecola petra]|uniref:FAD-binding domain-containing protein n=1 Tax=Glaciecola petra TaxID=3075602 RepID=A0ABU2ZRK7_9ALTE|nr:FAD-binding domain-containing protein [Aestuariibacter sp. P117]MDT0594229.1 FAD-binding domain-containing protein [Aestuariibacter sp. P117]
MIEKQRFSVVWLKRDLRLRDHQPIVRAIARGRPILLLYIVESIMLEDPHLDIRHWRFVYQSLQDLNQQLSQFDTGVTVLMGECTKIFSDLEAMGMDAIFSHEEIGLAHTYKRDYELADWCNVNDVLWQESFYGAVKRPLKSRSTWQKHWQKRIYSKTDDPILDDAFFYQLPQSMSRYQYLWPKECKHHHPSFQLGGEKRAWFTMHHFFKDRGKRYFGNIGKPLEARETCSRLSPYLAWGNLSLKQVVQFTQTQQDRTGWKASIRAFSSRLHWHCHFIQKFETESDMQYRSVNTAYEKYPYCDQDTALKRFKAWSKGNTGIPIIDASMLALINTGYLNFRMRAMLVSFLCHHLNVDWKLGVKFLASQFLDFEPGIHYPQFQMQAGITGTNTIRIYNPIKQSNEKDPNGEFIKKWLPQLSCLPKEYIHAPYDIPAMEAAFLNFDVDRDYMRPIIDVEQAAKEARIRLWAFRKDKGVRQEAIRIVKQHTVPD